MRGGYTEDVTSGIRGTLGPHLNPDLPLYTLIKGSFINHTEDLSLEDLGKEPGQPKSLSIPFPKLSSPGGKSNAKCLRLSGPAVSGFRVLGFKGLGFRVLGFRV